MSIKGVLNASAILLSCISGLLAFATFVLSSFYSTAIAEWKDTKVFREQTQMRLQLLEATFEAQQRETSRDIQEINHKLDSILEVKLKRVPPQ
jgi:hypothetical protein